MFEQAVAREALRLAYKQHKEFATTLKGVQQQRTVGDVFSQEVGGMSLVDNMKLDLLVASGGVLSHAPRMEQTAMMLIDSFEPEGFTTLAKDSIFMMPHLGVLASVQERAAMEVFERDCLIVLGTCVAAVGPGKHGKPCFKYTITGGASDSGEMMFGELKRVDLAGGETAEVEVQPSRGFDLGNGPGKAVKRTVKGGPVGIVLDARGRNPILPEEELLRKDQLARTVAGMNLYEEAAPVGG